MIALLPQMLPPFVVQVPVAAGFVVVLVVVVTVVILHGQTSS
jgi:hypothetical protein